MAAGGGGWARAELDWAADALPRYVVANRGDEGVARAAIEATLAWRRTAVPGPAAPVCSACVDDPTSHCIKYIGRLHDGRPVLYLSPPRARDLRTASCVTHLVCELEAAFPPPSRAEAAHTVGGDGGGGGSSAGSGGGSHGAAESRHGQRHAHGHGHGQKQAGNPAHGTPAACPALGAVWFVDLRGFSLLQSGWNPGLGVAYARTLASHFPERLATLLLVEPPWVFSAFLGALRPFVDTATMSKVVTLGTRDDAEAWIAGQLRAANEWCGGDANAPGREEAAVCAWLREAYALEPVPGNLPDVAPPGATRRG